MNTQGQKTGGRQKGTPNKMTAEKREFLGNLLSDNYELIQQDFTPQRLEQEFLLIAQNSDRRNSILEGYANLHRILGNAGASDRTATQIINLIRNK